MMSNNAEVTFLQNTPPISRERLIECRKVFFESIRALMVKPPRTIDKAMKQSEEWTPVCEIVSDQPDIGSFMISYNVRMAHKDKHDEASVFAMSYSLFQAGPVLRIGIIVPAFMVPIITAQHDDISELWRWDGAPALMKVRDRRESKLVEWVLRDHAFYHSYLAQEPVILGLRHLHFRILAEYAERALHAA